jgi:hypothetical protein
MNNPKYFIEEIINGWLVSVQETERMEPFRAPTAEEYANIVDNMVSKIQKGSDPVLDEIRRNQEELQRLQEDEPELPVAPGIYFFPSIKEVCAFLIHWEGDE